MPPHRTVLERIVEPSFVAKFESNTQASDGGCLVWKRACSHAGYGAVRIGAEVFRAHRIAWMMKNSADIPAGMEVDHLCFNVKCVNTDHLELVTGIENLRRKSERYNEAARQGLKVTAFLRERHYPSGAMKYQVTWRDRTGDKLKQRAKSFTSRDTAAEFMQTLLEARA